ncbi:hypothetical protein [Kitasatospora viridis]|uniref:Uncharacterized protein n=1 Tax=Kitasatospora viridis TaxID=281105 RepID=A0A561SFY2_9ACTN|nr:hypothetical protein [Kitasatospora viridis]TWF73743.1 hypothetical protein FHX73_15370 [Kitasatospora viridis]
MSDDQPTELTPEELAAKAKATQVAAKPGEQGTQTLGTKSIKGQVITHTIVKPLRD